MEDLGFQEEWLVVDVILKRPVPQLGDTYGHTVQGGTIKNLKSIQGYTSRCSTGFVDTKAKVVFQYKKHILKLKCCFDVN